MSSKSKDQIRLGSEVNPGHGAAIRRHGEGFSFGTFTEMKEGQPIREGAELICVGAEDDDGWRDVMTIYSRPKSGPAQVATPRYRKSCDRIFGGKQKTVLA